MCTCLQISCTREQPVTCTVRHDGAIVDSELGDINATVAGDDLEITRDSNRSYVIAFSSGISATVTFKVLPSFILNLPASLQGMPTGLLGNFDGNVTNDFTMPNGTMISINSSDSDIHEYGKTCKLIHYATICHARYITHVCSIVPEVTISC